MSNKDNKNTKDQSIDNDVNLDNDIALGSEINLGRRDLLKGITSAAVVGGVVAVGLSSSVNAKDQPQDTQPKKLEKGYHETQHIRDYFDSL